MDLSSAPPNGARSGDVSRIVEALEVSYNARSTANAREDALRYLDQIKHSPDAPWYGYSFARDLSAADNVRYFGLTLLGDTIKYRWEELEEPQANTVRGYVIDLAKDASQQSQNFVRNKIGQLWCEVAKRSWGYEWMDMDELLCQLWGASLEHRSLVLYILETLAEEIFNKDDPVAGLRGGDLGKACVNIFTPASTLEAQLPGRDTDLNVRCGDAGWVKRVCELLDWCLVQNQNSSGDNRNLCDVAVKALNTLRAIMPWLIPKAIHETESINHIGRALAVPVIPLQTVRLPLIWSARANVRRRPSKRSAPSTAAPVSRNKMSSTLCVQCLGQTLCRSCPKSTSGRSMAWRSTTWMNQNTICRKSSPR